MKTLVRLSGWLSSTVFVLIILYSCAGTPIKKPIQVTIVLTVNFIPQETPPLVDQVRPYRYWGLANVGTGEIWVYGYMKNGKINTDLRVLGHEVLHVLADRHEDVLDPHDIK